MLRTLFVFLAMTAPAMAQDLTLPGPDPTRLAPMHVEVFRELEDAGSLPVSVEAVPQSVLDSIGARIVSDAAIYAPNTFFSEFSARKLSNPRARGVGSSPLNPGVTTWLDGVPQFNASSSSIELLDIEQIEFARGPLGALFGRNTLGGVVSVTSRRPSLSSWKSNLSMSAGNFAEFRGVVSTSGPIASQLAGSVTLGLSGRDGFTVNDVTGRSIDRRFAGFSKVQLWWLPSSRWESRIIVSNELDRDGDYGLNDLVSVITNPFHSSRDYEGDTRRNVFSTTLLGRYEDALFTFSTVTGFVHWSTRDHTDLDYTAIPLMTRSNDEADFQFTQELRFAINTPAPITPNIHMMWQAGMFLFSQRYAQDAFSTFAPPLIHPINTVAVPSTADLDDTGFAVYGQTTVNFMKRFDLVIGLRAEREDKNATFGTPTLLERNFRKWTPQFAGVYHFEGERMVYVSFGTGYKSGGFNPAAPAGNTSYEPEIAYHVEGGAKGDFAGGRMILTGNVFSVDWNRMQLNQPMPGVPGQFFIANVDGSRSTGAEVELRARPHPDVDVFGGAGVNKARFDPGTISSGVDVSRNQIPNAPKYTYTVGTELKRKLPSGITLYGHFDTWFSGGFKFDDLNSGGQKAYSLVNFRAGARGSKLAVEFFMKNAADTHYIPVAFHFDPSVAPSGFLGEMGTPRRYGVSAQVQMN